MYRITFKCMCDGIIWSLCVYIFLNVVAYFDIIKLFPCVFPCLYTMFTIRGFTKFFFSSQSTNECMGFRPPLCTYRLNISRSQRLPIILYIYEWAGKKPKCQGVDEPEISYGQVGRLYRHDRREITTIHPSLVTIGLPRFWRCTHRLTFWDGQNN